jgi:hypothetical protein
VILTPVSVEWRGKNAASGKFVKGDETVGGIDKSLIGIPADP